MFIVGIDVINECSTGFCNSGCLLYKLLKPEEGGSVIPSRRLFEEIYVEITRGGREGRERGGRGWRVGVIWADLARVNTRVKNLYAWCDKIYA